MTEEGSPQPATDATVNRGPVWQVRRAFRWARRLLFQQLPADQARAVRDSVDAEGVLTERFALMCALSAGIATIGLLQSSAAVVIGAMLVSPLMGPIAALGFGFASLDGLRIQVAARTVIIGALTGIGVGMLLTWLSPVRNATPEIIARTAPTLLDLAVALLSGLAGGYATVQHKGETAIGVAIATALMPPLATLGYSIAVMRLDFIGGAGLLFLTNLAAIAFAFALVARLRGVAKPLRSVEFKTRYVILGFAAFLLLATPLALTLLRVTQESQATVIARRELTRFLHIDASQIAQLTVTWAPLDTPHITAIVITPDYLANADTQIRARLTQVLHHDTTLSLRQVVSADTAAQTRSLIDAALENRTAEQIASAAPIAQVRSASAYPSLGAWSDDASHTVVLLPAPIDGVSMGAYRAEETRMNGLGLGWHVTLAPPFQQCITIGDGVSPEDAIWALQRWGVARVTVSGADAEAAATALNGANVAATANVTRAAGAEICAAAPGAATP